MGLFDFMTPKPEPKWLDAAMEEPVKPRPARKPPRQAIEGVPQAESLLPPEFADIPGIETAWAGAFPEGRKQVDEEAARLHPLVKSRLTYAEAKGLLCRMKVLFIVWREPRSERRGRLIRYAEQHTKGRVTRSEAVDIYDFVAGLFVLKPAVDSDRAVATGAPDKPKSPPGQSPAPVVWGLLDEAMQAAFPRGEAQLHAEAARLHPLLQGRLDYNDTARVLAKAKMLLALSPDRPDRETTASIVATTQGKLTPEEARLIYAFVLGTFVAQAASAAPAAHPAGETAPLEGATPAAGPAVRAGDAADSAPPMPARRRRHHHLDGRPPEEAYDSASLAEDGACQPVDSPRAASPRDRAPTGEEAAGLQAAVRELAADGGLVSDLVDSASLETVVIRATHSMLGVRTEYEWVRERYGVDNVDWKLERRAVKSGPNGRVFETFFLRLKDGTQRKVRFDITAFFGR